ncbi:glucuronate isomerase [Enterococcus sp. HY326]|uniref:glucuronate isomerase n=1 Tax=Enterococcus sp. HY326 TaxID=2971265 RepID=UPI002240CF4C|nr:glucuronate isomerase [Enterococcus sp. HY326]
MKTTYQTENFLLRNPFSIRIYHEFAKKTPVIDYHCHLKPNEIYNNRKYANLTELWLQKDHYKWRLMRANGIPEKCISGNASDKEKFLAWVETIERAPGNPLFQWSHMELEMYFGINLSINKKNAELIWEKANAQLGKLGYGARDFIHQSNVHLIGTTDNPLSSLEYHQKLAQESAKVFTVVPTLRLDNFFEISDNNFFADIYQLSGFRCESLENYLAFVGKRIHFFLKNGCRSADLGLVHTNWQAITTNPASTYTKMRKGKEVNQIEKQDLNTYLLIEIMKMIYQVDWVLQLHIGAAASVNQEAVKRLGKGTGFDSIIDQGNLASSLLYLFNEVNNQHSLPKVILYNIDGTKNVVLESIMACFQDNEAGIKGKIQHGPAWWFQDTLRGNRRQLADLAEQGILMNFIGMTTDSRSFLSYARHDYFRRILCDCLGNWIEAGEVPDDDDFIQEFIESIAYRNALDYFNFSLVKQ